MIETDLGAEMVKSYRFRPRLWVAAISGCAVGAVALPEEFTTLRIDALAQRLELFRLNFPCQAEHLRSPALPLTRYTLPFGVVVAVLQMACGVACSVGHGANGEHV